MTKFNELILSEGGRKLYRSDKELFEDMEVETYPRKIYWFYSPEVQNFVSQISYEGNNDLIDEMRAKTEKTISRLLDRKVRLISLDNSEEEGTYD